MKKKKTLIIVLAVVAVGLVALIVATRGSKDSTFDQDFHVEDTDAVTKIFIADKNNSHVLLERVADSTHDTMWTVDTLYPASQPMVDMLLETLHDMRIREQVSRNAVPNIIRRLSSDAVKVEVYQKRYFISWFGGRFRLFPHEKLAVTYYVGQSTQDQMASFMFRKGDKVPYVIHIPGFRGFLTPRFSADPYAWRSHTIVHWDVHHLQRVEVDIPGMPEESFAVYREGEGFAMELTHPRAKVGSFDTARVAQMLSCFANLNFDEFAAVVPNAAMDYSYRGTPRTTLKITNTNGDTRVVKTYLKYANPEDTLAMPNEKMLEMFDVNRLYALIDDKDSVVIQYFVFDNILQPASYFLGSSKNPFAKE